MTKTNECGLFHFGRPSWHRQHRSGYSSRGCKVSVPDTVRVEDILSICTLQLRPALLQQFIGDRRESRDCSPIVYPADYLNRG